MIHDASFPANPPPMQNFASLTACPKLQTSVSAEVAVSKESAATLGYALPAKSELRCSPVKTRLSGLGGGGLIRGSVDPVDTCWRASKHGGTRLRRGWLRYHHSLRQCIPGIWPARRRLAAPIRHFWKWQFCALDPAAYRPIVGEQGL